MPLAFNLDLWPKRPEQIHPYRDIPSPAPQTQNKGKMPVIKDRVYENANEGIHNVTISRIDDLGMVEGQFGTKDKIRIIFTTEQEDSEGNLIEVRSNFTKSLHKKSGLTKFLKALKINAADSFDTDELVGLKLQIVVVHNESDGKTYANIDSYLPVARKTAAKPPVAAKPAAKPASKPVSDPADAEVEESDEI